jgi:hypothetical protein
MKLHHFAGAATLLLASTQVPQAVPIAGNIGFTGGLTLNSSSVATASQLTSWINPQVNVDSGAFAIPSLFAIAPGTPALFSSAIWNFNTTTPIMNFWSVGGFTFELLTSYIAAQGGAPGTTAFLDVNGTGLVSGNGYTPTVMSFNLTTQDPLGSTQPIVWTFSASGASTPGSTVADGGSSVMLLGLALSSLGIASRKFSWPGGANRIA